MPLTPAEIEQWLASVEGEFDGITDRFKREFPEVAEHSAFVEKMIERQKLWLTNLLAEAMRRGMPITQDRLDYLIRRMAVAFQSDC